MKSHDAGGASLAARQIEQVVFGDATVWNVAQLRSQAVTGAAGDDVMLGFAQADQISGGEGNDTLYGKEGDDTYQGGTGSDVLQDESSTSNDTYRYDLGDGADTITDAGGSDTIQLGSGITAAETTIRRNGAGAVVLAFSDGGTLTLNSQFNTETGASQATHRVEQIVFADGAVWDQSRINAFPPPAATDGADEIYGFEGDDQINGGAGSDTLDGGAGHDSLIGGDGSDQLFGRDGNDSLDGGADADYLHGDAGNDLLRGGAGSDTLYGGEGDDVYEGGAGADGMYDYSAASNDTYGYNLGDGADTVWTAPGFEEACWLESDRLGLTVLGFCLSLFQPPAGAAGGPRLGHVFMVQPSCGAADAADVCLVDACAWRRQ
jgi:Ca2+-binding RTX toxin-like protein